MTFPDEKKTGKNEKIGSRVQVFLFLRLNPDTWYSPSDIAKSTELREGTVKSALKIVSRHPLIEEKGETYGYFRLLK